uniref:NAC domain-containing protein n=1 Tax=Ananas comosus var. bracteatus TaxID=296719 RepID=A0A6V7Q3F3_ANACO|nr:unnamed protein product [Ananas comosus var. bracteatus]
MRRERNGGKSRPFPAPENSEEKRRTDQTGDTWFRFHPTDEELVNHYLKYKFNGRIKSEAEVIPENDVCKCEPWNLPGKSLIRSNDPEWFFFAPKDRKYANEHRRIGRRRRGERAVLGPDVLREAEEKVRFPRKRLITAQSRQQSYADKRRRDLEFAVEDRVFLKVSPMRGVKRFGVREKLSPRYIGPYEVLERVGAVAYRLALPPQLADVHNVFHVSNFRKYVYNPKHAMLYEPPEL